MLPLAIPYPEGAQEGYWGPVTSTIDWCEENYVVFSFVAEAMNTVTNLGFVLLAGYALRNAIRYNLEWRFKIAGCGFILVGIGSWLFHMTLWYEFQLLDELPMIYATCIPLWSIFSHNRSSRSSTLIALSIAASALFLTAIYLWQKDPTLHQAAFGLLNVFIIVTSIVQTNREVHDVVAKRNLRYTLALGVGQFLFGWLLWNTDVHFCHFYRSIRRTLGMPYGFLLEMHAAWHILTCFGVYSYMQYLEYLHMFIVGKQHNFRYIWKFGFFPVCERIPSAKHD